MRAVVVDPRLAQHLPAKAAVPLFVVMRELSVGSAAGEGVRGRSQSDDRLAGIDVIDDVFHLVVGQVAEPRHDDHQVGIVERLGAGNVAGGVGRNCAVFGIDGKQHRAFEAVMIG